MNVLAFTTKLETQMSVVNKTGSKIAYRWRYQRPVMQWRQYMSQE